MPKYTFKWDYKSSGLQYPKGATVELEKELAEWIEHDSPGVLELAKGKAAPAKKASTAK